MLSELRKRKLIRFFDVLDRNQDGVLSPEDFKQTIDMIIKLRDLKWPDPLYEEIHFFWSGFSRRLQVWADKNADGKITQAEWIWYLEQMLYQFEARYIKRALIKITLVTMDFSKDQKVSLEEFTQFYQLYDINKAESEQAFSHLDLDKDGYLTKDELTQLFEEFLYSEDPKAEGNWFFGVF
ncbi:MAG: EF-hand domain-containing protein [Microcystaceae cyanobacterium]